MSAPNRFNAPHFPWTIGPERYALVDCNSFYASCECVFRPDLAGQPVVVLSNNDGCIIARNQEAKALGFAMGAPYHQHKTELARAGVRVFSSNYTLYGDLSKRVMDTLRSLAPAVEVYSIDEGFVQLTGLDRRRCNLETWARYLRRAVLRATGAPVSIGVAPTKTLAKLANRLAKRDPAHAGVAVYDTPERLAPLLAETPVKDLWGIARGWGAKLEQEGLDTALQLAQASPRLIQKRLTIRGAKLQAELRGQPSFGWCEAPEARKMIASTRSFGRPITTYAELREAVSAYVARAAEKLRADGLLANTLMLYIRTNPFQPQQPQYRRNGACPLPHPTADTALLLRQAEALLRELYRPGYPYAKAGVMLLDMQPQQWVPQRLFDHQGRALQPGARLQRNRLMHTLDRLNLNEGADTVRWASTGLHRPWSMRSRLRSPRYTTRWEELPRVC